MKSKAKLFKKFGRKISVFTVAIMVLQPLLMVGVMPQKAYGKNYDAPADQKGDEDTTTTNWGLIKNKDGNGAHVEEDETLHVDTFDLEDVDDNAITGASLKIRYKTNPEYNGTAALEYALEGEEFADSTIVPTNRGSYKKESFDLFAIGIDTKEELEDLDVRFTNNSTDGVPAGPTGLIGVLSEEDSCDVIIDYLWIDLSTNKYPEITITETPDKFSSSDEADFEWEAQDDKTDESKLKSSFRVDDNSWSDPTKDLYETSFAGLSDGPHTFDLRVEDKQGNVTGASYDWTIDTSDPEITVDPLNTNNPNPTITGTHGDPFGAGVTGAVSVSEINIPEEKGSGVETITVTVDGQEYEAVVNEDGTWTVQIFPKLVGPANTPASVIGLSDGVYDITVNALDMAGNLFNQVFQGVLTVDTTATSPVTNLTATPGDNQVSLSWTNPSSPDFAGVRIYRDGTEITTGLTTFTSYTDTTAVNGTTYTYDVYAYDALGNRSEKATVSATPSTPSAVVPAVATTPVAPVTSTIVTEEFPTDDGAEIKAATDEEEEGEGDTEIKDDRRIPVWGILFLLILAAIGGYLFYVQNPDNFGNSNGKK